MTLAESIKGPSRWTHDHIKTIGDGGYAAAPVIVADDVCPIVDGLDLWDHWPVQDANGDVAVVAGAELWISLAAARRDDPNLRHDVARMWLLERRGGAWRDLGPLLPDGLNPGSREWSGSALYDGAAGVLHVYFTATGRRGAGAPTLEQRLMMTRARATIGADGLVLDHWASPETIIECDPALYVDTAQCPGAAPIINGFRDPSFFYDAARRLFHILFAGSVAGSQFDCNGCIGHAVGPAPVGPFALLPPIVTADGVVNELERPQILAQGGRYYLFWSSQRGVFAPAAQHAPTGLYGMVADAVDGPYVPVNGTGLVFANPPQEARQAYCWQVLNDGVVTSFVDYWGLDGRDPALDAGVARAQFGGTFAPRLAVIMDGSSVKLG
ncbi:MAG: glycoside hydrolase family 68 protein [Sphingopyxis sp.]